MTSPTQKEDVPIPWHPVPLPCPRCSQPLRIRATRTFTKLTYIRCRKCAWHINLEALRLIAKQQHYADPVDPVDDSD